MKLIIIAGLGFFIPFFLQAQTDTLFFGPNDFIKFRVAEHLPDQTLLIKDYDQQSRLRIEAQAHTMQATIKQGPYTYYDTLGKLTEEGNFQKGYKTGLWNLYFSGTQRIKEKRSYKDSPKGCYIWIYDSICATLKKEGMLDEYDRKNECWKEYYPCEDSLRLHYMAYYQHGYRQGKQIEYYKTGQIKRIEIYENRKLQSAQLFDSTGKKLKYYPAFMNAEPRVNIKSYLTSKVACFEALLKNKDIVIRFLISQTGKVLEAEVIEIKDGTCKADIETALLNMKAWKPYQYEHKAYQKELIYTIHYYTPRE